MEIFTPNQTPQPPKPQVFVSNPQPPVSKNTFVIIGMGAAILIILGIIGYLMLNQPLLAPPPPTQSAVTIPPISQPLPSHPVSPTPTGNPIDSWNTFLYPLLALKLPADWKEVSRANPIVLVNYSASSSSSVTFNPAVDAGKLRLEIATVNTTLDVAAYVTNKQPTPVATISAQPTPVWQQAPLTIDSQPAIQVKTDSQGFSVYIKDPKKQIMVIFSFLYDFDNSKDLTAQILSTIQFADIHPDLDLTQWKTDQDATLAATIQYPPSWFATSSATPSYVVNIQNVDPSTIGNDAFTPNDFVFRITKPSIQSRPATESAILSAKTVEDLKTQLQSILGDASLENTYTVNGKQAYYREFGQSTFVPTQPNKETFLLDGKGTVLEIDNVNPVSNSDFWYTLLIQNLSF